jgi:hypothetical protein
MHGIKVKKQLRAKLCPCYMNTRNASIGITKLGDDDIHSTAVWAFRNDFSTIDSWGKDENSSGLQVCIFQAAICPYLS